MTATTTSADESLGLHLDGIGAAFGGLVALDGVAMSVRPGQVVGVIGPNGAGKTTLFNVICGFVRPTGGLDPVERCTAARQTAPARRTRHRPDPAGRWPVRRPDRDRECAGRRHRPGPGRLRRGAVRHAPVGS